MRRWLVGPLVFATFPWLGPVPDPVRLDRVDASRRVEVARIQRHFDSVLVELQTADRPSLSRAQSENRDRLITTLARYRDAGVFPHNYDFPGEAVPYFVDRVTGVRCAVAHLLDATGRNEIVTRVAATNNNVRVSELASDRPFAEWLDEQGITLSEAARIQVPYMEGDNGLVNAMGSERTAYGLLTAAAVAPALATAWWNSRGNSDGQRRLGTVLGLTTGVIALGVGGMASRVDPAPAYVTPVTIAAGGLTAWLSTRGYLRHRKQVALERSRSERNPARVAITPTLPTKQQGAGVVLSLSF